MIKYLSENETLIGKKEKMVYNVIRHYKRVSRKQLQQYTKLKIATLYRTIDNLLKQNFIKVSGVAEPSKGGRPSELFSINESLNFIMSIAVYRDHFKVAVTNLEGNILDSRSHEMDNNVTPQFFIESAYEDYVSMLDNLHISSEDVIGVGLGCVGPIDIEKGIILNPYSFQGAGWSNTPIVSMLMDKLNKRVIIDNIARGSVGGQYWLKYVNQYDTMAYVTVEKGVGVGLISNGVAVRGKGQTVRGLGHMVVDINGKRCRCGNYGCVQTYSSIEAIKDQIISEIKRGRRSSVDMDAITFEDINRAYEEGDDVVTRVLYDAAHYFATGIINYTNIVEVELIVIGGQLIEECPHFNDLSLKLIHEKINKSIEVVLIDDEENSVLSGMAMFLLDTYLN